MNLSVKHPLYNDFVRDWIMMKDTYRGERVIKSKGVEYLPATSGMQYDGMLLGQKGYIAYNAYKERAVFHNFVSDAVEAIIGMMHSRPPVIELPAIMEPMKNKATKEGENLEQLLRRINEQQLVTGRLGLLADFPLKPIIGRSMPYISLYTADNIINWDDGNDNDLDANKLNLVVLDETEYERKNFFDWERVEKYRVLALGDLMTNEGSGVTYRAGLFTTKNGSLQFNETEMIEPVFMGRKSEEIPFCFINSKDNVSIPDDPPLAGLARLSLTIYRGEADYRQNLFMQGQDTLVIIGGGDEEFRVGAGATIILPQNSDAKYIGVTSEGLAEQRQSLENDCLKAMQKAGQFIDGRSKEKESGDALKIRIAAQSATINQIALSGAAGLQQLLRIVAIWMGANPEEVIVTPNLDFVKDELTGRELIDLMAAKTMGAPLSLKTIHKKMQEKNLTELELKEELDEIDTEPVLGGMGTDAGGNPQDGSQSGNSQQNNQQ